MTRDRVTYDANWRGRAFTLVDTGGWLAPAQGLAAQVAEQASIAVDLADAVLFVVDARVGATDEDEAVANVLRRAGKPVVLVANKVDDARSEADALSLWSLGLGEPVMVSAMHGRGSGDMLDLALEALPEAPRERLGEAGPRRVALIGKPNVGKSSLLNKLVGEQRAVVDSVAGTTRDPVDELIELGGTTWRFVDTAGIRKRFRDSQGADYYATLRTQGALDRAEVAVVLIDASEPLTEQDLRILTMVVEAGRALVIAYNKWDLADEERRHYLEREIERQLYHVRWAPRVNISAMTGRHVERLVPAIEQALAGWEQRISTGQLNTWLNAAHRGHPAAAARRQAAARPVRHPGGHQAAALRAVHDGIPRGDLPPVHRAPPARGLRLRRQPDQGEHADAREARQGRGRRPQARRRSRAPAGDDGGPARGRPAASVASVRADARRAAAARGRVGRRGAAAAAPAAVS